MKIKEKDEAKAATSNLWKPHDCSWKGSEPLLLTYASHRIVWKAGQFCYLHWQTECKNIHLHVFHKRYLQGINMQKNWKWKNIKDRPHKYYTEESRNSSGTQDFKLKIQLECSDMVNIQYPASIQEVRALVPTTGAKGSVCPGPRAWRRLMLHESVEKEAEKQPVLPLPLSWRVWRNRENPCFDDNSEEDLSTD